ncbi:DUF159 family protein [Alsobacter soli]|uniref:Abasic site processing protein n=1 Tax=Alsobacter soli TaxID=2109933 RepID=A0A2T1HNE2_9HYPH|nr:SOS response-associated peptidase [Alsobacter soli]PSC03147.1 DUF159 family protein [Alsobacter soli]
MCGRFALTASPAQVRALFRYEEQPNFPPRTNVSPTEPIAIVTDERGRRAFKLVRWGFIPTWVKDTREFPLLINARCETLADKPAFRNAVRRRRCLVPADGFYEWRREGEGKTARKQPYLIRRRDGQPMALAGLWETYVSPDGGEIDTALIVTTQANGLVAAVHDRMPVIIEPEQFDLWLDCAGEDPRMAAALMRPCPDEILEMEACDPRLPRPERPAARPAPARKTAAASSAAPAQGSLF